MMRTHGLRGGGSRRRRGARRGYSAGRDRADEDRRTIERRSSLDGMGPKNGHASSQFPATFGVLLGAGEDLAGACCHSVEDGAARYGRWFGARNASVSPKLANDTKRKKVAASKIVGAMQKWGRFVEVAQTLEQNSDGVLETLRLVCLARTNPFEALYANARNAA